MTKDDGLFLEMEFRKQQFIDMLNWNYEQPNIYEIKMEDLIRNPYEHIIDVFIFMDMFDANRNPLQRLISLTKTSVNRLSRRFDIKGLQIQCRRIPIDDLLFIVYNNRFSKKTRGRKQGNENIKSHYRKGVAGDWINVTIHLPPKKNGERYVK